MDGYRIIRFLARGEYATVTQSYDERRKKNVAVKSFANNDIARTLAENEFKAYTFLQLNENTASNLVNFYDTFEIGNRRCFAMELLGSNLLELMEITKTGFDSRQLQGIARSLLLALSYLHERRIIHSDLKPEHVVCENFVTMNCKVVDLSTCIWMDKTSKSQTTNIPILNHFYRAPECIIRAPFDEKIDLFSVGLIISQLSCKTLIFKETHTRKLLAKMIEYLGYPPRELVLSSVNGRLYFSLKSASITLKCFPGMKKVVPKSKSLGQFFENINDEDFINFLKRCLDMDPEMRGSAKDLQSHRWLVIKKTKVTSQSICIIL